MSYCALPVYKSARAAAARLWRLREKLPGSVQAVNYERMAERSMAYGSTPRRLSHEAGQDIALDALDEYLDLSNALMAAAEAVPRQTFYAWFQIRVLGRPIWKLAEELNMGNSTVERRLRTADEAVTDSLIERDILRGFNGRDGLENGATKLQKGVRVVWFGLHPEDEST